DALIANLGSARSGNSECPTIFFGVEDRALALQDSEHAVDSVRCQLCGAPLVFDARLLSHLGHYRCEACGMQRPVPAVAGDQVVLDGLSGAHFSVRAGPGELDLS